MKKLSLAVVCLSYLSMYTSESPQNNTATLALLELCKTTIVSQSDKSEINDLLNGNKFDTFGEKYPDSPSICKEIKMVGSDASFTLFKKDNCLYINTFCEKELFNNLRGKKNGNKLDNYTLISNLPGDSGRIAVLDVIQYIFSLQTKIPLFTEDQKIKQALDACKKVAI